MLKYNLSQINIITKKILSKLSGQDSILLYGELGSGKTTFLNALSGFVPDQERIISIEDVRELQLQQTHVVRLQTRPSDAQGRGEVTTRDLLESCLRMRPDRILIGEVRGGEALDLLNALNSGHGGTMCSLHANSASNALSKLLYAESIRISQNTLAVVVSSM